MPIIGTIDSQKSGKLFAFEGIATNTVSGSPAASLGFSNIPQTYRHLRIIGYLRSERNFSGNATDATSVNLNGSGLNSAHAAWADGFNQFASASVGVALIVSKSASGNLTNSNLFSAFVMDIYNYRSTTNNKSVRTWWGVQTGNDGAPGFTGLGSGLKLITDPITSVDLLAGSANLSVGSHLALYGIG